MFYQTRNPFPCNNDEYPYQDQSPQCQIIQTTPQQNQQDPCLEVLKLLKEVNELTNTTFQKAPSFCGGPHDDYQCQPYYEPD